jgi:hypothetical protein
MRPSDEYVSRSPTQIYSKKREVAKSEIMNKMTQMAFATLHDISEPMPVEHLYRLLVPPENFDVMWAASHLLRPRGSWSVYTNINIPTSLLPGVTELIEYCINYGDSGVNLIIPQELNSILPGNELGHKLLPVIDIAIQWQTIITLTGLFFESISSLPLIAHMLPHIRLIIPHITIESDSPAAEYFTKILNAPLPRYVPGVSKWFGQVCRYGLELVSLHSVVKKNVKLNGQTASLIPVLSTRLIEDGLQDHFFDFCKNQFPPKKTTQDDVKWK